MATYKVTMHDLSSFETFSSLRAAVEFARKVKDDHRGASVYRMAGEEAVQGDDVCLHSWTEGEDGKVRKVNVS